MRKFVRGCLATRIDTAAALLIVSMDAAAKAERKTKILERSIPTIDGDHPDYKELADSPPDLRREIAAT